MKVISIGTDRNIFKQGSAVEGRTKEYGTLFDELHIVVFSRFFQFLPRKKQISDNVWAYGTNSFSRFFYIRDAKKTAKKIFKKINNGSKIIVTTQDPFETGLVGLSLKKDLKLPLHVQIHTDFLSPHFSKGSILNNYRLKIAKRVLKEADALRVVSKKIMHSLSNVELKSGVVPTVLPIFVDVEKFEKAEIKEDLKKKYPQYNFIILIASRLTKEKNIPMALEVVRRLSFAYPKIGLVIVGSGPEKGRLERLTRRFGIQKHVVFESWKDDLISYYKTANLFLLTSDYEGYGMSIVEAISSHCPVVSTDVGIASEILKDGEKPFVCGVRDTACFFKQISHLIENPQFREHYVHEAHNHLDQITAQDKKTYLSQYKESIEAAISH